MFIKPYLSKHFNNYFYQCTKFNQHIIFTDGQRRTARISQKQSAQLAVLN